MNGLPVEEDEPAWRKLKLTLERPYTDDQGNPIRQLLDVTPEGQQIYEPCACIPSSLHNDYPLTLSPGLRIQTSNLQRTSAGCLLSGVTTFSRRGILRAGESTTGIQTGWMTNMKKPVPKPRIRPRNP